MRELEVSGRRLRSMKKLHPTLHLSGDGHAGAPVWTFHSLKNGLLINANKPRDNFPDTIMACILNAKKISMVAWRYSHCERLNLRY